jgi:hypothetical protein
VEVGAGAYSRAGGEGLGSTCHIAIHWFIP